MWKFLLYIIWIEPNFMCSNVPMFLCQSINQSVKIYIVPLQDTYSEALPTMAKRKRTVLRRWWN